MNADYPPQRDLVGQRFCPLRAHARTQGRVAVVLRVNASNSTGCGVRLTYRYEDSPPQAEMSCSQRWFLENFSPIAAAVVEVP